MLSKRNKVFLLSCVLLDQQVPCQFVCGGRGWVGDHTLFDSPRCLPWQRRANAGIIYEIEKKGITGVGSKRLIAKGGCPAQVAASFPLVKLPLRLDYDDEH